MSNKEFLACILTPIAGDELSSSSVILSTDGKWKTSSFYLDSSGRSSVSLPLQLKFQSKQSLENFLFINCINPMPSNYINNNKSSCEQSSISTVDQNKTINIEAKVTLTFGTGSARTATVEGVSILSTRIGENINIDDNSIYFNTEIIVRVSRVGQTEEVDNKLTIIDDEESLSGVKTNLEITAVFTEKLKNTSNGGINTIATLKSFNLHRFDNEDNNNNNNTVFPGVIRNNIIETRLYPSLALHVELTHALSISVKSFSGSQTGHTLLSLTMTHSNTHQQPVTITSIALHPGHSRYMNNNNNNNNISMNNTNNINSIDLSNNNNNNKTIDMSKTVKWGYITKSDPNLPLKLERNETFSTIITVDASEDTIARSCICPLSITAIIGNTNNDNNRHYYVVAAVDAIWSTCPTASIEPSTDSFRIDMNLYEEQTCYVGIPLTVVLDVYNLSSESKQLMLLVDNNSLNNVTTTKTTQQQSNDATSSTLLQNSTNIPTKSVIISEQGGYKFGVWGLSSATPPTSYRDTPDEEHDLLAVDVALLLGEVKGQSSTKAKIRVIPLREGTIRIPNFQLVDNRTGKRYSCCHQFHATVAAPVH